MNAFESKSWLYLPAWELLQRKHGACLTLNSRALINIKIVHGNKVALTVSCLRCLSSQLTEHSLAIPLDA